jgi:hypothetical protein
VLHFNSVLLMPKQTAVNTEAANHTFVSLPGDDVQLLL